MKRLIPVALLALTTGQISLAQEISAPAAQIEAPPANGNAAGNFENTSAAIFASPRFADSLGRNAGRESLEAAPSFAAPAPAAAPAYPAPASPNPRFVYGGRDDFRWQLALGGSLVRFRSSLYFATAVGLNSSITYFTNEWLGVEGNINAAFAPTIYKNEHVKYVGYGAGPKVAWRRAKWEPFAHALVGGLHILPQTAASGQNGFEVQVGGGADYRIYPHLSMRAEVDWIKTHVFAEWGNSASANIDVVLHF
jgi:hypothetical protein